MCTFCFILKGIFCFCVRPGRRKYVIHGPKEVMPWQGICFIGVFSCLCIMLVDFTSPSLSPSFVPLNSFPSEHLLPLEAHLYVLWKSASAFLWKLIYNLARLNLPATRVWKPALGWPWPQGPKWVRLGLWLLPSPCRKGGSRTVLPVSGSVWEGWGRSLSSFKQLIFCFCMPLKLPECCWLVFLCVSYGWHTPISSNLEIGLLLSDLENAS